MVFDMIFVIFIRCSVLLCRSKLEYNNKVQCVIPQCLFCLCLNGICNVSDPYCIGFVILSSLLVFIQSGNFPIFFQ